MQRAGVPPPSGARGLVRRRRRRVAGSGVAGLQGWVWTVVSAWRSSSCSGPARSWPVIPLSGLRRPPTTVKTGQILPSETSSCSMFRAMSGSKSRRASMNSRQKDALWPRPSATKSQAESCGHSLTHSSPPRFTRSLSGDSRPAMGSMPCQNRCEGSISVPTLRAPVFSTSRLRVGGLKTRFCGCISIATLTPWSPVSWSIPRQNGTATWSHW